MIEAFMYSSIVFSILGFIAIVFTLPYMIFGLRLAIKQLITKKNVGLVFVRNTAENYGLPHIIDLREVEFKIKTSNSEKIYFINREHFRGFRFLGLPTVWMDNDNMITSIGLHFHKLDEKGEPVYDEDGKAVVTMEKPSFSLEPSLVKAIIGGKALNQAMAELFQKHKTQIYILGAIGLGLCISIYLAYELKSVEFPLILEKLNEIKEVCQPIGEVVVLNG